MLAEWNAAQRLLEFNRAPVSQRHEDLSSVAKPRQLMRLTLPDSIAAWGNTPCLLAGDYCPRESPKCRVGSVTLAVPATPSTQQREVT